MECVKHVHQIQTEVLLEPNNVTISAMKNLANVSLRYDWDKDSTCLDDTRIRKYFIEVFQLVTQLKWINNPVLLARTDLHQAYEATVCAIAMIFQIDCNFPCLAELVYELRELGTCGDPGEGGFLKGPIRDRISRLEHMGWIVKIVDFVAVWMWWSTGALNTFGTRFAIVKKRLTGVPPNHLRRLLIGSYILMVPAH